MSEESIAIERREKADKSVRDTVVKEETTEAESSIQTHEQIERKNQEMKVAASRVNFLRDPLAPGAVNMLARIEYIEFLRAQTEEVMQHCRITIAIMAYIYFLTSLLKEEGTYRCNKFK
jgi:hypothetical protein